MDTITHALSGALVGRAMGTRTAGGPTPAARTWAGLGAGAFPDADIALTALDPLAYLTLHRGITHSLILLPLWAWLLALALAGLSRGRYRWRALFPICAAALGIHILGDVITSFGTQIFAPLTDWRASLDTTFIIDPYLSAGLLAALLASIAWHRQTLAVARSGLAVLALYVGAQGALHEQAQAAGWRFARAEGIAAEQVRALPQPLSPARWKVVVVAGERYYSAFVDLAADRPPAPAAPDAGLLARLNALYQPPDRARWQHRRRFGDDPREQTLARAAWHQPGFAGFRSFAALPVLYRTERADGRACAWYTDLRFTLPGRVPPFRFGMCRNADDDRWHLDRLPRAGTASSNASAS